MVRGLRCLKAFQTIQCLLSLPEAARTWDRETDHKLKRFTAWLGRAASAVLRASTALAADEALLLPLRSA